MPKPAEAQNAAAAGTATSDFAEEARFTASREPSAGACLRAGDSN